LSLYVTKIVLGVPTVKKLYGLCLDTKDYFYHVALRKIREPFQGRPSRYATSYKIKNWSWN